MIKKNGVDISNLSPLGNDEKVSMRCLWNEQTAAMLMYHSLIKIKFVFIFIFVVVFCQLNLQRTMNTPK